MVNIDNRNHIKQSRDVKSIVVATNRDETRDVVATNGDVTSSKQLVYQIPIDLPLGDLHNQYKKNKRRSRDVNAFLVGHLVQQNLYKRKKINEFVPLNSGVLRNLCGGNYSKYLQKLIDLKVIEQYSRPTEIKLKDGTIWKHQGTYSTVNGISKRYRLLCDDSTPLKQYTITDKNLVRKINDARIQKIQYLLKNNSTARSVYESIKKITIDCEGAIEFIKSEYDYRTMSEWTRWFISNDGHSSKTLKKFIRDILNAKTKEDRRTVLIKNNLDQGKPVRKLNALCDIALKVVKSYARFQSRLVWIKTINAIQNGNHSLISMSQDKYSGRIYHTFTLTARNIRPFLKLDNQTLVEFDGANCQWMLFTKLCNILCKPSFYNKTIEDYGIKQQETTQQQDSNSGGVFNMLHSFFDGNKNNIENELNKLTAYLSTNRLRKMVVDAEAKRGKTITESQAKVALISNVLFGNVDDRGFNQYRSVQAFKQEFPLLLAIIYKLKKYWIDESVYGYKAKDIFGRSLRYKAFPRLLQRMESDLFVKGMQNAQCDFLTLHDAIVTNDSGAVEVKQTLDRVIDKSDSNIKLNYKQYA